MDMAVASPKELINEDVVKAEFVYLDPLHDFLHDG